jgi:transcriptional regulator with XRE-family HTH domain
MKARATDFDRLLGAQMLRLRTDKGLSQGGIAKALGVTRQQVAKYERGTDGLKARQIQQLADLLDVEIGEVMPSVKAKRPEDREEVNAFRRVFLVGAPGQGKSRLSAKIAELVDEHFTQMRELPLAHDGPKKKPE